MYKRQHLRKTLKDEFRTAGNGYMYTYRYATRMLRIDYIFHSPSLKGIAYYSPDLDLCSDHNPCLLYTSFPMLFAYLFTTFTGLPSW